MRLLCLADIHGKAAGLASLQPDFASVDLVVVAGDITHLGGKAESTAVLAPLLASGVRVIAVGGNMDRTGVRDHLGEQKIDIHGRGVLIDNFGFMGLGGGTPSPFNSPWELRDEEAQALLAAAAAEVAGAPRKVLVSHAPPRDTDLDRVRIGLHAGSTPVRAFLLSNTIDLCICGHIHEAGGREIDLGGCLCVNVGPFASGRYALVTLGDGKPSVTWRKL